MNYYVASMLKSDPEEPADVDRVKLAACIAACFECARTCTACADACLSEDSVAELTACIRTNLDCADICTTTGHALSRYSSDDPNTTLDTVRACWIASKACADECEKHADMHEHCRICAETCRRCEVACAELLERVG